MCGVADVGVVLELQVAAGVVPGGPVGRGAPVYVSVCLCASVCVCLCTRVM
jgi:hypothetical protein